MGLRKRINRTVKSTYQSSIHVESTVLEFFFKRQYIHFCKMFRRADKNIFVSQEAANLDIGF